MSPGSVFGISPAAEADPWFADDAMDPWTAAAGARRSPPPHYRAVPVFPAMEAEADAPSVAPEAAETEFSMSGEPSSSRHAAPSTGVDESTALMRMVLQLTETTRAMQIRMEEQSQQLLAAQQRDHDRGEAASVVSTIPVEASAFVEPAVSANRCGQCQRSDGILFTDVDGQIV